MFLVIAESAFKLIIDAVIERSVVKAQIAQPMFDAGRSVGGIQVAKLQLVFGGVLAVQELESAGLRIWWYGHCYKSAAVRAVSRFRQLLAVDNQCEWKTGLGLIVLKELNAQLCGGIFQTKLMDAVRRF